MYFIMHACMHAFLMTHNLLANAKTLVKNMLQADVTKRFGNLKAGSDDILPLIQSSQSIRNAREVALVGLSLTLGYLFTSLVP